MAKAQRQESLFEPIPLQHGGDLSIGRRRSRRPLATDRSLHITSRSHFAKHERAFKRNTKLVENIADKFAKSFGVKVHIYAIAGNHVHFFIRGRTREAIQNFLRTFAGQVAQQLLKKYPIGSVTGDSDAYAKQDRTGCKKNQRTFWETLIYSRVVANGPDFKNVFRYIEKNIFESLYSWAYTPRKKKKPRYPS